MKNESEDDLEDNLPGDTLLSVEVGNIAKESHLFLELLTWRLSLMAASDAAAGPVRFGT